MTISSIRWRFRTALSRLVNTTKIASRAPILYRNWLVFFSSRFRTTESTLDLRNGLRLKIRAHSTDRAAISEVFMLNAYGAVAPGSIVVDVGANIGAFTLFAAGPANHVYSIEPVSGNFEALSRNVNLNSIANVSLYQVALAKENGSAEISIAGVYSSLHYKAHNTKTELVKTITLEGFLAELGLPVDYLKMDCEGAEWEILLNSSPKTLSRIKHIEMEFHKVGNYQVSDLQQHLQSAGFRIRTSDPASFNGFLIASRPS